MIKKKTILSLFLTIFVIGLILLSGPASAVTVDVSQPNNANKGSDISFSISVDINDPDTYLPIKYTNIILTGPNGFSKTCKVNMDSTNDCADVDVTIINNADYGYGYGYGYDSNIGYGYNFGYGYGYSGAYGQTITFDVIWHTPTDLVDGTYNVNAQVHAGSSSHDFTSSQKSFSITTASTTGGAAPSYGGTRGTIPITETTVPTPAPIAVTPIASKETAETGTAGEGANVNEGIGGPTGMAVTGNILTKNPIASAIVVGIVVILGIAAYFGILKKKP